MILCSLIAFSLYGMYFGPTLLAKNKGRLNIYTTTYIVLGTELLCFIPTYIFIEKIRRRRLGIILFSVAIFCALVFTFIDEDEHCSLCLRTPAEVVFMITFRAAIAFFFSFFDIYIC
jgi:hypothetical protein